MNNEQYQQFRKRKIGRRYEYSIQWLLQNDGWEILPRGKYGFNDGGIDLIASKGERVRFIQCKGWGLKHRIHENVIDQLFGSVAAQVGIENIRNVEMYVYTSGGFTPYAIDHAKRLNIQTVQRKFPLWHRKKNYI